MDEPLSEAEGAAKKRFDAFKERAVALGLTRLSDQDLAVLEKGWRALQPQLRRIRDGLNTADRPLRP
jgi:hypothetical protein